MAEHDASEPWRADLSHPLPGADGLSQRLAETCESAVGLVVFSHRVTRPREVDLEPGLISFDALPSALPAWLLGA